MSPEMFPHHLLVGLREFWSPDLGKHPHSSPSPLLTVGVRVEGVGGACYSCCRPQDPAHITGGVHVFSLGKTSVTSEARAEQHVLSSSQLQLSLWREQ